MGRVERGIIPPSAQEILTCELIFGLPAKELFPRFCAEIEDVVMQSAIVLHERYKDDSTLIGKRKRELVALMLERSTGIPNRRSV